ncbi:zinc-binding oxidoreductase CipB [Trichoderma sp. SZMC 28013]
MAVNVAAWAAAKGSLLESKPATLWTPANDQILVKNSAIAVNPIDVMCQTTDFFDLKYPSIFGHDVAGEVVAIGPGVSGFRKGDRVIGHAAGFHSQKNEEGGFQAYTILRTNMASKIPQSISFERAVVLPLGMSTAAAGLFQSDLLGLELPTIPARKPLGKTLLVWGGASSVGSCVVQLAVAAGYEVITTASPKNFEYVKKLGASEVYDYNQPSVISELAKALNGKDFVGIFDTIGGQAWGSVIDISQKVQGSNIVATVLPGFPEQPSVDMKYTYSFGILDSPVSKALYEDFLPAALEAGTVVPAPDPLIVGTSLGDAQKAMDVRAKGVSAQKIVLKF